MSAATLLSCKSACEQVSESLTAISKYDPELRALITVTAETARERASAIDDAVRMGKWCGITAGLTITVKDVIKTAGIRTTNGSQFENDELPDEDAKVITDLKRSGGILVGKANLHEFAYGGTSQNPFFGSCRNAWDATRIPGGSSGGSAVSVAAGMCRASLGTDTAGSGRLPAALNGVACLRPTPGRISLRGVTPVSPFFDTISPIARRVSDIARIYVATGGYDPLDPASADRGIDDVFCGLTKGISGLRLGVPRRFFFDEQDAGIEGVIESALAALRGLGAELVDVDVLEVEQAGSHFEILFHTDCAAYHAQRLASEPGRFGKDTLERLQTMGGAVSGTSYSAALSWARSWRRKLEHIFRNVDALVHATVPVVAPTIAECQSTTAATRRLTKYCYPWSLACMPVLTVPCGFVDQLPCGMSVVAPWWREDILFRIGAAYQQVTDWHLARPPLLGPEASS